MADRTIERLIRRELEREEFNLILIASENYVDPEILHIQGSILTNKYAEGYPGRRYYGGCKFFDEMEALAQERAKRLFCAEHANVQPHSGTSANMAVLFSVLEVGDKILGMDIAHGGHLTHGYWANFSGRFFRSCTYGVSRETELIDYDEIERIAKKERPKLIIAGASAYSRVIDFQRFRQIADEVGAYLMVDMAHIAGLVAAGIHPNPTPHAHFVTSTTHKTLRGPRGGFVLCKREFAELLDRTVFPGIQGGPLMHVVAAKAVTFGKAMKEEFKAYQKQVVRNAKALSSSLSSLGYRIVSSGTETHLFLVDLRSKGITGKEAQEALEESGIMVNKNLIPFDTRGPFVTSGIRIGTPAVTSRGMKEREMERISSMIDEVLTNIASAEVRRRIRKKVRSLCEEFPMYAGVLSFS